MHRMSTSIWITCPNRIWVENRLSMGSPLLPPRQNYQRTPKWSDYPIFTPRVVTWRPRRLKPLSLPTREIAPWLMRKSSPKRSQMRGKDWWLDMNIMTKAPGHKRISRPRSWVPSIKVLEAPNRIWRLKVRKRALSRFLCAEIKMINKRYARSILIRTLQRP